MICCNVEEGNVEAEEELVRLLVLIYNIIIITFIIFVIVGEVKGNDITLERQNSFSFEL